MNDKLKRLAHKMLEFFTEDVKTPTDIYIQLTKIAKNQKEYFQYLGPSSMIKLTIYIYCFQNFKDLKLADKLIDRLLFAEVFYHNDERSIEECANCVGGGYQRCYNCEGSGGVSCDTCDGDGDVNCNICDGDGTYVTGDSCSNCEGDGRINCGDCFGRGEITCDDCEGTGEVTCDDCEGIGEFTTDDTVLQVDMICTWSNRLKSVFELNQGEPTPSLSESEYDSLSSEYIKLNTETTNLELREDVRSNPNEVFCVATNDEPELLFGYNMFLIANFKDYNGMSNFIV
jgi:hypothetical protein